MGRAEEALRLSRCMTCIMMQLACAHHESSSILEFKHSLSQLHLPPSTIIAMTNKTSYPIQPRRQHSQFGWVHLLRYPSTITTMSSVEHHPSRRTTVELSTPQSVVAHVNSGQHRHPMSIRGPRTIIQVQAWEITIFVETRTMCQAVLGESATLFSLAYSLMTSDSQYLTNVTI